MIIVIFVLLILTILIPAAGVSYFYLVYRPHHYPDYDYRYKITVEVATPEGVKKGSSVIAVHTTQMPEKLRGLFGGHAKTPHATGEAPFVDLGERGILFTAFQKRSSRRLFSNFYNKTHNLNPKTGGIPDYATTKDFKAELPENWYPSLVRFTDVNNPMSVEEVTPDNMANLFGEGVKVQSVTIEATEEPLQWKLEKELTWLPEYYSKLLDGNRYHTIKAEHNLANSLGAGSFSFNRKKVNNY